MPTAADCEHLPRQAGLRLTAPRSTVLTAVHDHPHADTDSIMRVARTGLGSVSTQTAYDVLRASTAARLVRRIEPAGSVPRHESRVGDNHRHVVCRSYGAVADGCCAVGHAPSCSRPSTTTARSTRQRSSSGGVAPSVSRQRRSLRPKRTDRAVSSSMNEEDERT